MRRLVAAFVLLSISLGFSQSQEASTPSVTRDPAGVASLQRTLASLGGGAAATPIRDSIITGTLKRGDGVTVSFTSKRSGKDFRYESHTDAGTDVFVSGHGAATYIHSDGKVEYISGYNRLADFGPEAVGVELAAILVDDSYDVSPPSSPGNKAELIVTTSKRGQGSVPRVTKRIWHLDVGTGIPLRVEVQLPDLRSAADTRTAIYEFGSFQSYDGRIVPIQYTITIGNGPPDIIAIQTIAFNVGIDPTEFDAPSGGAQ